MTVIAWDGYTVAADRCRMLDTGIRMVTHKLVERTVNGRRVIIGRLGHLATSSALQAWVESDRALPYPTELDPDRSGRIVVFDPTYARPTVYFGDGHEGGMPVLERFFAWGSGGSIALGALAAMKPSERSARKAVAIASKYDSGCGMGMDSFSAS